MYHTRIATGIARLVRDRRGVTAIEYGLIASAIALVIVAGAITIGQDVNSYFEDSSTAIESVGD